MESTPNLPPNKNLMLIGSANSIFYAPHAAEKNPHFALQIMQNPKIPIPPEIKRCNSARSRAMPARKNYRSIQMPSDTGGIFKIPSLPDSNLKDSIPHSLKVSISAICLNPQKHFGTGSSASEEAGLNAANMRGASMEKSALKRTPASAPPPEKNSKNESHGAFDSLRARAQSERRNFESALSHLPSPGKRRPLR